MTATSSHPSSPQLSRICLVACTSSGTVAYSHFAMTERYRGGAEGAASPRVYRASGLLERPVTGCGQGEVYAPESAGELPPAAAFLAAAPPVAAFCFGISAASTWVAETSAPSLPSLISWGSPGIS